MVTSNLLVMTDQNSLQHHRKSRVMQHLLLFCGDPPTPESVTAVWDDRNVTDYFCDTAGDMLTIDNVATSRKPVNGRIVLIAQTPR